MTRTATPPAAPATPPVSDRGGGPSTGLVITVLALCGTLVSLQQTLVLPLLPDFPEILGTSAENASWLVTVTLLAAAVGTPIVSRLADMMGKRLMMLVCLGAVILGSVVSALSASLPLVITGRGLAGLGSCLVPVGISIMRDQLPADRVGSGVALMSATLGIGGAVGMPLAGVIYRGFDWHALFVVSGAFAVVMFLAVLLIVPESTVRTRGRFDYGGALLLSVALTCLLLPISKAGAWGWQDEKVVGLLLTSVLVFAVWVPMQLRAGQPLVDIRTSVRRTVLLTNTASILIGFGMFTNFLTSAQQLQMPRESGYGLGLSVVATGLALLPGGLLMVLMSPVAAGLIRRYGPRLMLISGAVALAVGFVLRVFLHGSLLEILLANAVGSIGTALAFASMPTLIMRSVPITETASANGLNTLLRAIGTSTASATVAAVLTMRTLPAGFAGAETAVPTLGAYQTTFWLGAVAALAGATIAGFIRRPLRASDRAATAGEGLAPERHEVKAEGTGAELIVRGVVTTDTEPPRPIRQAVVTVLHPDGRHVDWGRTDGEGRFALALPEEGTYLVVASADGWAPQSGLVHLDERGIDRIRMHRRLTLTGRVTDDGEPLPGVMLSLIRHAGDYVATTRTREDGSYELGLPPPGRYVLTVVDTERHRTRSRAVQVGSTSATLDVDVVTGAPRERSTA